MPKISIIIPVYNVENYLQQCLDSVVNQTYKDIEIIIIDDGSTDGSGNICDEYAAKDERIRVIHKANEGLSQARNQGIELSTAPYIMFVDSDDWVEPLFCEEPLLEAESTKADLVLFLHYRVRQDGQLIKADTDLNAGILREDEAIKYNMFVSAGVWIGLYNKKLFDTIKYPVGKYYEDIGTSHRLIHEAKRISLIHSFLYYRLMERPGSITADPKTRQHPDKNEMEVAKLCDLYKWGYYEYSLSILYSLMVKFGSRSEEVKPYADVANRGQIPKFMDWKQRLMLRIFRLSPTLFDILCTMLGKRT